MRTVTFKSVCDRAFQRYGTDPSTIDELDAVLLALGTAIDDCVGEAWQWSDWPELTDVQLLTPDVSGRIAQTGDVWRVFGLYTKNPEEYPDAPRVNFVDRGGYAQITNGARPANVWTKFWIPPGQFTRAKWTEDGTYVLNDVRYFDSDGECYRALKATQGEKPSENPESWERQLFPYVLRNWAALNGAAMLHEDDGQFDKGNSKKADAFDALLVEQDNFKSRTHADA